MWDLPRPQLEPVSPALAGGFLTVAPLGKSPGQVFVHTPQSSRDFRHPGNSASKAFSSYCVRKRRELTLRPPLLFSINGDVFYKRRMFSINHSSRRKSRNNTLLTFVVKDGASLVLCEVESSPVSLVPARPQCLPHLLTSGF